MAYPKMKVIVIDWIKTKEISSFKFEWKVHRSH